MQTTATSIPVTLTLIASCGNGEARPCAIVNTTLAGCGFTDEDMQKANFRANLQEYTEEWGYGLYEGHFSLPAQKGEEMPETVQFDLHVENPLTNENVIVYSETMTTKDLLDGTQWQDTPLTQINLNDDDLYHHLIDLVVAWADKQVTIRYEIDLPEPQAPTPAKIHLVTEILGKVVETIPCQPFLQLSMYDNTLDFTYWSANVLVQDGDKYADTVNGLINMTCGMIDDYIDKIKKDDVLSQAKFNEFKARLIDYKTQVAQAKSPDAIQKAIWGLNEQAIDNTHFNCLFESLFVF